MILYSSAATWSIFSGSLNTIIDCNHSYFLSASNHTDMILIMVTLSDHNHSQWNRSIKITLSFKLKLRFINGSIVKPTINSTLHMYWIRCNDIIISWILNTVSPKIRQSIMYMTLPWYLAWSCYSICSYNCLILRNKLLISLGVTYSFLLILQSYVLSIMNLSHFQKFLNAFAIFAHVRLIVNLQNLSNQLYYLNSWWVLERSLQ